MDVCDVFDLWTEVVGRLRVMLSIIFIEMLWTYYFREKLMGDFFSKCWNIITIEWLNSMLYYCSKTLVALLRHMP